RARQHGRRLRRVVHHERGHLDRRRDVVDRDGLRDRLRVLHRHDLRPARRHPRQARMSAGRLVGGMLLAVMVAVPFLPMHGMRQYVLHVLIQIFIWSFIGGAWALMGRFGLVSLGHRPFLRLGAYTTTLALKLIVLTAGLGD